MSDRMAPTGFEMTGARRRRGMRNHRAGLAAEGQVAGHYSRMGFDVVAQRTRTPYGEIDLIVRDRDMLVFVEVKQTLRAGSPDPIVSPRQWRRIHDAAAHYLAENAPPDQPCRIDVAVARAGSSLDVYPNAGTLAFAWE